MKKFTISSSLLIMLFPVLFASCDKEICEPYPGNEYPDDSNGKPPVAKQLKVALNNEYTPADKVDSAMAIWEVNGTAQTVKLETQGNQLATSLSNLQQSGQGTLTIQLYTKVQVDGRQLQWESRLPYTLDRNTDKILDGPGSIKDPSWNPRAIFKYGNPGHHDFSFIVGIRPNDPYFELKGVRPEYAQRIDLIRTFYTKETGALVAIRDWVCSAQCLDSKGNLVNREHFLSLPGQLAGKQWNKARISAYFYLSNNPGKVYEFFDFSLEMQ